MNTVPPLTALPAPAHWRTVDFISDLHLNPEESRTFEAWEHYMLHTPADAVFILGDLFEVWVGDDAARAPGFEAHCGEVLRVAAAAMDVFFMRGNRDFLVGTDFLSRQGVRDLPDPTVLAFAERRHLLTHGDLLCIDDIAYQQFRREVRSDRWQASFLSRALPERQAIARQMREHSQAHQTAAGHMLAHADTELARRWLTQADATVMIHGHTHQPADHDLGLDATGRPLTQIVLSDWHITAHERRAQVLRLTAPHGLQRVAPTEGAA